ncbi:MAG: hypothetical protein PHQ05_08570 [Sterolibacterium sp.]|nr:hypothetical protein [Sterolibacterium sp.]
MLLRTLLVCTFLLFGFLFFLAFLLRFVLLRLLIRFATRGTGCRVQNECWRRHKLHCPAGGNLHSLPWHGDQRVHCATQINRCHGVTAFNRVVKRYLVFRREVEDVAGTSNPDGRGRGLHLELVFVETCDCSGKGAHCPFQQGNHAIAGCIRRSGKTEFIDAHFSIGANCDESAVVHAQLGHPIGTGNDQFAGFDFTATHCLARPGGIHHADIA